MSRPDKPIGVLHHLSSSGGTLIARTLAAMPDAVVLSEVHPVSPKRIWFNTYDPVPQFQGNYPALALDLAGQKEEFARRIECVWARCRAAGKVLVLRNHAHTDFLTRAGTGRLEIEDCLPGEIGARRAATIRDPVDAWLSMQASDFAGQLSTFDDYCQRVERFISHFDPSEIETYEDFVADAEPVTQRLCERLCVDYRADEVANFAQISLSGNSGRGRDWTAVQRLSRRPFSPEFRRQVLASRAYRRLAARFGYPPDPMDAL